MQWSSIKDHNEKVSADGNTDVVTDYKPQSFTLKRNIETNAKYVYQKSSGATDFVMNPVTKVISGIEAIEKENELQIVEKKVVERLTEVQQQAHDEAYKAGLEKGFKAAYEAKVIEINQTIDSFKSLVGLIENIKSDMVHQNEAHIVECVYRIAEKIVYGEIAHNPDLVLPVIRKAIETAQAEEQVTVLVSPEQLAHIEDLKKITNREFDFLKNVTLEASPEVREGGCIVETNYGEIDARIEKRIEKIWSELRQSLPKIKKMAG